MITKVRLKNWKSHLDSEFIFTPGVNALIGINGAGKSSVLDAISFGLFGTFPNHSNRKIGLDDLIMGRPAKKDEAEVYLEFSSGGKKYSIFRKLKTGKGTIQAEIREGGNLIEVNPSGVTEHIEKILQMDYPLFSKAVYSEQNNIDYFLTIPKGKRMQHIDRMLNLDRFEAVRSCLGSMKNIIQAKLSEKLRMLSQMEKEDIAGKMENSKNNAQEIENSKKSGEAELSSVKDDINKINSKLLEIESKEKKFLETQKMLAESEAAHKEISINLEEKLFSIKNRGKESITSEIENLKKELAEIENKITTDKQAEESFRNKVAYCNSEIKTLNEALSDLQKITGSRCPICENEIPEGKKSSLMESRRKSIGELRQNLGISAKEIQSIKNIIEISEKECKQKIRELEKLNFILEDFGLIERMKSKLQILSIEMERFLFEKNSLEKEILEFGIKNLRLELAEKSRKSGELQSKIFSADSLLQKENQIFGELLKKQAAINNFRGEAENYARMGLLIENFSQVIRATQEQLREEFTKTVNSIMADVWTRLYPYSDFEALRLSVIDGDYVLEAKNMQSWIPVDGFASGGERSLACLALRVAFSLAFIPKLKWLILDEPTHNLDSNSIQKFSSVLSEGMQKFVNQIFLITHEAKLVEDIEGAVYVLQRDKSVNGVTKVVKV